MDAVSTEATSFQETQPNRTADLERKVEISERQPANPKIALKTKSLEREERDGSSESSFETSSRELSSPRVI